MSKNDERLSTPPREQGEPPLALRLAMLAASMETSIADTNCAVFVNGTPPMQTQIQWIREAVAALERTFAPSESERRDTERLNWLERMVVEVRAPLQWGSRQLFIANPVDVEGMEDDPSDLRAQIDYQQNGGTKP